MNARNLRLACKGYEARLSGPLWLRDTSLDMTGEILLKGDLVSVLGSAPVRTPPGESRFEYYLLE